MPRIDVRLSDMEKQNLDNMSLEADVSQSEILRMFIRNYDLDNVKISLENQQEVLANLQDVVVELKYMNLLVRNLANNENQIAHKLNVLKAPKGLNAKHLKSELDKLALAVQKTQKAIKQRDDIEYLLLMTRGGKK